MEQSNKARHFDEEFKKNAVKLLEDGRSIVDVAQALGIHKSNLYNWRKKYQKINSTDNLLKEELKDLRKKLKQVEQERDILKKALSIFSRHP